MKEHRKLAAIMFTDMTGYSAMMSKDEKLAMEILEKNRNIHKSTIAKFSGEYIKEIGDGTLAIFHSSLDAVNCAIIIQKSCRKDSSFSVRIGIHIGDIIFKEGDVFGEGVNIASRIEAGSKAAGIYISERVYEDIKNKHNIKVVYVGEKMLKNIDYPVKIYSIDADSSVPVKKLVSHLSEQTTSTKVPGQTKKTLLPRKILFAGVIATIMISVAWLVFFLPKLKSQTSQKRIVVALFENRTGDASLDMLGKMAADWITQGLSHSVEAYVVPTTTVIQISSSMLPPAIENQNSNYLLDLAKVTKADIIVSGSYYLQKETLQFQVEVKNVNDGSLIYSMPAFTGPLQKPMEIIEKLSSEIIGGLAYDFRSNVRFISKPPNMEAYNEYLAAMGIYSQDPEGAIQHLIRSIKMDSLFCPSQFELAYAYMNISEHARADSIIQIINRTRERLSPYEQYYLDAQISVLNGNYAECLRYLRLAENISPGDWDVNYAIGVLAVFLNKPGITVETYSKIDIPYDYESSGMGAWRIGFLTTALHFLGNYKQELIEAKKGQQYYPDQLSFYQDEMGALAAMGQIDEIKKIFDRCQTISSRSGTMGEVICYTAGELRAHGFVQAAGEYAGKAVEWYRNRPASEDVREYLAFSLYIAENWEEAQNLYEQLAAEFPENIDYLGYLGALAARKGDREKAINISEQLKRIDRPYLYGQHTYCRARIAAQLGEREQAVELLREAFAQGKGFDIKIHSEIDFEPLHDYRLFLELLKPKE